MTLLSERTETFATVPRTETDIYEFQKENEGPPPWSRPFPDFYHCPFLGLIGSKRSRAGCLLHPEAPGNNGVDYRSLSWYGEQACRTYFCPATRKLSTMYKEILVQAVDDWYIFGLIATEHTLLTAYFTEVESRLGRRASASDFKDNVKAVDAFKEFAEIKFCWPFCRLDAPGPCHYLFDNGLYPRPGVLRPGTDLRLSSYETIFKELDSGFTSAKEIEAATQILNDLFSKTVRAIEVSPLAGRV